MPSADISTLRSTAAPGCSTGSCGEAAPAISAIMGMLAKSTPPAATETVAVSMPAPPGVDFIFADTNGLFLKEETGPPKNNPAKGFLMETIPSASFLADTECPRLGLVRPDSPMKCVFEHVEKLRRGAAVRLYDGANFEHSSNQTRQTWRISKCLMANQCPDEFSQVPVNLSEIARSSCKTKWTSSSTRRS